MNGQEYIGQQVKISNGMIVTITAVDVEDSKMVFTTVDYYGNEHRVNAVNCEVQLEQYPG